MFDLRGYPRRIGMASLLQHITTVPARSALFEVPFVRLPDRQQMTFTQGGWPVAPAAEPLTARKAFITGGRAISAAETVMGIVESFKLAEIVGGPTAGTNGNINPMVLPGGYQVVWTGMRVRKHDGSVHHGVGIQPTVPATRTLAGVRAGRDELLERAVEAVDVRP